MVEIRSSLPRYKCHKEVHAVKIAAIEFAPLPKFSRATCRGSFALGTACGSCERCTWEMEHGARRNAVITPEGADFPSFTVGAEYIAKHKPEVGGYFVEYVDGYQSFSPAKAFEEGYALIA
jgi:hypothetical protein